MLCLLKQKGHPDRIYELEEIVDLRIFNEQEVQQLREMFVDQTIILRGYSIRGLE